MQKEYDHYSPAYSQGAPLHGNEWMSLSMYGSCVQASIRLMVKRSSLPVRFPHETFSSREFDSFRRRRQGLNLSVPFHLPGPGRSMGTVRVGEGHVARPSQPESVNDQNLKAAVDAAGTAAPFPQSQQLV
jgi:hypothetical protein